MNKAKEITTITRIKFLQFINKFIANRFPESSRIFRLAVEFDYFLPIASAAAEFKHQFLIVVHATQIIFAQFPVQ